MLIEIISFLFLGTLFGTFTGLIPGIHINLISVILISLSVSIFSNINPIYLVVFITAMAITHTFLDFIPSVFLGCPDTDTELSILPGHEMLKQGLGYEAVTLSNYGSLVAIFILIIISVPAIFIVSKSYNLIEKSIPFLLIAVSLFMVFSEKQKTSALAVFLLTGILGFFVLNLQTLNKPLLPLLTGLFGSSMLIISIKNKFQIPKQIITKTKPHLLKPLVGSAIASPICSFLPGLGSGQAAIIGNTIARTDRKGFLILLGSTNTLVMGFSFISLYAISRTRTGAAAAIQELTGILSGKILFLILIVVIISGIVSFFLTNFIAEFFAKKIEKVNYTKLSAGILIFLTVIVYLVSDFLGLITLILATFTGIYSISLGVRRTQMMGALLLPTIIYYLFQ